MIGGGEGVGRMSAGVIVTVIIIIEKERERK